MMMLRLLVVSAGVLLLTIGLFNVIGWNSANRPRVIESKAQAWIRLAPEDQSALIEELRQYAQEKALTFKAGEVPHPFWKMIEVTLSAPSGIEIGVDNATQEDKFSAGIFSFDEGEDWEKYWTEFREYVRARMYKNSNRLTAAAPIAG